MSAAAVVIVIEGMESRMRRRATGSGQAMRTCQEGKECFQKGKRKEEDIVEPFDSDSRGLHQGPRPGHRNDTSDCPPWCLITRGEG